MGGCASSTEIGVLTGGVGVHRGSTGALGNGAALLTALVRELCVNRIWVTTCWGWG